MVVHPKCICGMTILQQLNDVYVPRRANEFPRVSTNRFESAQLSRAETFDGRSFRALWSLAFEFVRKAPQCETYETNVSIFLLFARRQTCSRHFASGGISLVATLPFPYLHRMERFNVSDTISSSFSGSGRERDRCWNPHVKASLSARNVSYQLLWVKSERQSSELFSPATRRSSLLRDVTLPQSRVNALVDSMSEFYSKTENGEALVREGFSKKVRLLLCKISGAFSLESKTREAEGYFGICIENIFVDFFSKPILLSCIGNLWKG